MQWLRGRPILNAHKLCVSLNSRLESNKEEEEEADLLPSSVLGRLSKRVLFIHVHPVLVQVRFQRPPVRGCAFSAVIDSRSRESRSHSETKG